MSFIGNYQEKVNFAELEKVILDYWDSKNTFKKSIQKNPEDKAYQFYDGPPFATGLPHYGHLLGSTIKDVIGRYWTMKGYRVERVWGWDCHGLPIENMVEKELKLKGGKKGIEDLGIENFNASCKQSVLKYDEEWKKIIRRIGRWVDMENSYKTMDNSYIESVWWGFKQMYENGHVYEGRHVILYCPRCATPLSNFEIAMDNSYQEVEDTSLYVKFKLKNEANTYLLAWTTTPWTLPGNVGLAVDQNADYVKVSIFDDFIYLAESRLQVLDKGYSVVDKVKGSDLVGKEYEPLYSYLPVGDQKAYYVAAADFVSMSEGTGIVHTAAIYGEDDYQLAIKIGLPTIPMLDDEGKFLPFVTLVAGQFYKNANPVILNDLKERNLLLKEELITHSYPFCYRCDTPLYYSAVPAWFINIQDLKKQLLAENENINWVPSHFKHGQFKNIIESSPDWNISRSRYWGSPMPVWECSACHAREIIGGLEELEKKAVAPDLVKGLTDLHRPFIDSIKLKCGCGGEMSRIPEVFDCWVESASMPFAAVHYPFENTKEFEERYPADFIAEYVGQVRAWFNVLHRISVALFKKPSFKNVVVTGVYLGTDGKKMSKSRKNFPDPTQVFEKYGVDSLRFYMMSTPVMKGDNVILSEKDVEEVYRKVVNIFFNLLSFYKLYINKPLSQELKPSNDLDRWVLSLTSNTVKEVTASMDGYDVVTACRKIQDLLDNVSTWYLRRSRDYIKDSEASANIFGNVLVVISKLLAPVSPFISELVHNELTGSESVHLVDWPAFEPQYVDLELEDGMKFVRLVCEKAHFVRKQAAVKIRQPLKSLTASSQITELPEGLKKIISEELNVKEVLLKKSDGELSVTLDLEVSEELLIEGLARDFIRSVQALRKESGTGVSEKVEVEYPASIEFAKVLKSYEPLILEKAGISKLVSGSELKILNK